MFGKGQQTTKYKRMLNQSVKARELQTRYDLSGYDCAGYSAIFDKVELQGFIEGSEAVELTDGEEYSWICI